MMKTWGFVGCLLAGAALIAAFGGRTEPEPPLPGGSGVAALAPTIAPDGLRHSPAAERVVESQRKRIMGRSASLPDIRRIVAEIAPLVEAALQLPEVQDDLRASAAAAGMEVEAYRRYFQRLQEADLLLESGGNPDAVSVANAVGVAQFLASTGRAQGLQVDEAAGRAATRRLREHDAALRALAQRPASWSRAAPNGEGTWSREDWIAHHERERERAYQARRAADERYDPAKAIAAQTRYLLRLTRRYGGVDWALKAYHGGEGGVHRTVNLYYGREGSTRPLPEAVLARLRGANRLSYEELYFNISPRTRNAAFSYVYGRSDDHRYYYWKVLMAERAIALYRHDSDAFTRQWEALRPGQRLEAVWYPERDRLAFRDLDALRRAYAGGELLLLPPTATARGLRTENFAALDPENAGTYKGLRPAAMGTLFHLADLYRESGGGEPLTLIEMTTTEAYARLMEQKYPQTPPPGVDPGEWQPLLDYHPTGFTFNLRPPRAARDRHVLQYALGQLADAHRITWQTKRAQGPERLHVIPNPAHAAELAAHAPAPESEAPRLLTAP